MPETHARSELSAVAAGPAALFEAGVRAADPVLPAARRRWKTLSTECESFAVEGRHGFARNRRNGAALSAWS